MKRYRIGNTLTVTWSITKTDGSEYELEKTSLTLYASVPGKRIEIPKENFEVSGNTIIWEFNGDSQKLTGPYSLTLVKTINGIVSITLDKCNAFELVPWSCLAGGTDASGISTEASIELESSLDIISDTILSTVQEKIDNLKKDLVGEKSVGGGEIFNDYTNNSATGSYSHAEGRQNSAAGDFSHAEGLGNTVSGRSCHIEGEANSCHSDFSHCEGNDNTIEEGGNYSHVEGKGNTITAEYTHVEGINNTSSGYAAHVAGDSNEVESAYVSVSGYNNKIGPTAASTLVSGTNNKANSSSCLIVGNFLLAENNLQVSIGRYNTSDPDPSPTTPNVLKPFFVVGNGTADTARSDAFRILGNGTVYADNTTIQPMADYAEMFEWADGNPDAEDRVGFIVALSGDKIVKASGAEGEVLIGIISGAPTIIGDAPMRWQGKYLNDEWGRPIYEDVAYTEIELQEISDGNGKLTKQKVEVQKLAHVRKVNPDFDPTKVYVPREERPEWSAVGLLGKVLVRQDGTLVAGGFCKPNSEGIATTADSGYYVLEVKNGTQARVLVR